METEQHVNDKRLPENLSSLAHKAFILQGSVSSARHVDAPIETRHSMATDPSLVGLSESTKRSLLQAASVSKESKLGPELVALAKTEQFGALKVSVQRTVLKALELVPGDKAFAREVQVIVKGAGFQGLSPLSQELFFHEIVRVAANLNARKVFTRLAASKAVALLENAEQAHLIRYLAGPLCQSSVSQSRKQMIDNVWDLRRAEFSSVLARIGRGDLDDVMQRETLLDFLHAPAKDLWFLNATELNGHACVVFGAPSQRTSLSYGRRWVRGKSEKPVVRLLSPDPSVRSGWTKPAADASTKYAAQQTKVTRFEEWMFVNWVEANYEFLQVSELKSGRIGPSARSAARGNFADDAFRALRKIASGRKSFEIKDEQTLAGRPIRATARPRAALRMAEALKCA